MNKLLSIAALAGSLALGTAPSADAGHGTCHQGGYSYGYYGAPGYYQPAPAMAPQAVAPAAPGRTAQAPRDGQVYRSFSFDAQPAVPSYSAPVAPVYPSYAPSYRMMGPGRGMDRPSYFDAGSKMQGRFGR